MKDKRPDRK